LQPFQNSTSLQNLSTTESNFSLYVTESSNTINTIDEDTDQSLREKWIVDDPQLYEAQYDSSHQDRKKMKIKMTRTIWKKNDFVRNYGGESPEDAYFDPNVGSSSSSSEEEHTAEQLLPILGMTKVTKQTTKEKFEHRSSWRVSHLPPYLVLQSRGSTCKLGADCSPNELCIGGFCKRQCHGKPCKSLSKYPRQCSWSGHCPQGSHCDNHGYCTQSCDNKDNQCHKDYYCNLGACIPVPAVFERLCDTNTECQEKEVCGPQGLCARPCTSVQHCGPKENCSGGFCLNTTSNVNINTLTNILALHIPWRGKEKLKKCKASQDCARGFSCSNHGHCRRVCSKQKFTCSQGMILVY